MKRGFRVLTLLVLLAALGGGAYYLYTGRLPQDWELPKDWRRPWMTPPPPEPVPTPAETPAPPELPPPTLAGEPTSATERSVATLAGFERTVRTKRASGLAWEDAREDLPLYENDAVRTFEKSAATIAFGRDDLVEVDQNALVVIKSHEVEGGEGEISLALLSADFLADLESKPAAERTRALDEAAARRQITLRPVPGTGAGGKKARVAVRTLPDRSTSIAALAGSLTILGPKGEKVTLTEKMVTRISDQGQVLQPRLLPPAPQLSSPEDGATYPFLRQAPRVDMTWRATERARAYRVVVATDPAFRRIFADEGVEGTSFTLRNLQPGTYYWRVRARDADGFEGPYSAIRSVRTAHDEAPPSLVILSPPEMFVSPGPSVLLKGKTDAKARVKVNGQKVPVEPDGSFVHSLVLKEGVNLATIEVVDPAGNASYGKRLITYKGAKRSSAAVSGNR
jgi:glucodextranase-like protein